MAAKKDKSFANNFFFVFAFIPYMQWVPCFIMNGHVRTKRYILMGFVNIVLLIALIFIPMFSESYAYNNMITYPKAPAESEYWGKSYDDFKVDGKIDWDAYDKEKLEWSKSPEYKKYEKALEEYYASEEYKFAAENNQRLHTFENTVSFISISTGFVLYFVYMVLIFFVERYRYLEALDRKNHDNDVAEVKKILNKEAKKKTNTTSKKETNTNEDIITHQNKEIADVSPDSVSGLLNVNSATEAEIEALPLINIVDAKKIIAYRELHGEFRDIDEFFASFNAKPHVIVKLQNNVTVEKTIIKPKPSDNVAKKRFDL